MDTKDNAGIATERDKGINIRPFPVTWLDHYWIDIKNEKVDVPFTSCETSLADRPDH